MGETMRAAVYKGNGILQVEEVPVPKVKNETDVLIKVDAASVCGSDIHVTSNPPGQYAKPDTILGHEFTGTVIETGSAVSEVKIGDHVVPDPILNCGKCPECQTGNTNLCTHEDIIGQLRNGGFAQYCIVPEHKIYKIPSDIPTKIAAQTEPLACVMNGMLKLNPMPSQRVLIFGAGAIGLIFIRTMLLYGVRNIAVCELEESRSEDARRCGAGIVINSAKQDLSESLVNYWGGLPDIAVDAVGAGKITEQAVHILKSGGRLLNFGQDSRAQAVIAPAEIVRKELVLMGSYTTHYTFPVAIKLQSNPELRLDLLISHELKLPEINKGIELVRQKKASRVIIYPNEV